MKNAFVFHPYRVYRYFLPFEIVLSIISFILVGLCVQDGAFPASILFCILGIGSLYFVKYFYDMAKVALLFTEDGLQIIGNIGLSCTWVPWSDCSYGYRVLYRGHNYLLLTNAEISCQMAKKQVKKNMRRLRENYTSGVTIHLTTEENTTRIFEYLQKYETIIRDTRDVL